MTLYPGSSAPLGVHWSAVVNVLSWATALLATRLPGGPEPAPWEGLAPGLRTCPCLDSR
ncbi:MAG TPA: hypothetical protein VD833_20060 [Vicinamibacterales bacterium]|nr:hypothetical protein [Vicinamibacterales bacterium]